MTFHNMLMNVNGAEDLRTPINRPLSVHPDARLQMSVPQIFRNQIQNSTLVCVLRIVHFPHPRAIHSLV